MYKVVYLPTARQQLENAVMYIAVDLCAPETALDMADEIDAAVQLLQEMPYRFPIYHNRHAIKHEIRFFAVRNYNIFYVVKETAKTVEIWRILHHLQNADIR